MTGNGDDLPRKDLRPASFRGVPFFIVDGVEHRWGIEADIERMGPVRKRIHIDPERVELALDAEIRAIAPSVDVPLLHAESAATLKTLQLVRRWLLGEELKL